MASSGFVEGVPSSAAEGRLPRTVSDSDLTRAPVLKGSNHFPHKMHDLLEYAAGSEHASAISWTPDCRAFAILDKDALVQHLLPLYFKQRKYRSFTRQLNLWGFERATIRSGDEVWMHENFVRGRVGSLKRQKIKGAQSKAKPENRASKKRLEVAAIHRPKPRAEPSQEEAPAFGLSFADHAMHHRASPIVPHGPPSQPYPTSISSSHAGFHPRRVSDMDHSQHSDTDRSQHAVPPKEAKASDEELLQLLSHILDDPDDGSLDDDLSSILSLDHEHEEWTDPFEL
ncbi:hypothetical protein ACHAXT_012655 [Thalassiosira profunda]